MERGYGAVTRKRPGTLLLVPSLLREKGLDDMLVRAAALGLRFCTVDILVRGEALQVLEAYANVSLFVSRRRWAARPCCAFTRSRLRGI